MAEIVPVFIVGIVFFSLVSFVKILSDNKIRHKLIEKNLVDDNVKYLYSDRFEYGVPSALKWGMVLIGVGLAFLIGQLVPSHLEEKVTIASLFILAGLGLVLYYFIAKKIGDRYSEKK